MQTSKKRLMDAAKRRMNEYSHNGLFETPSFEFFYKQVCTEHRTTRKGEN